MGKSHNPLILNARLRGFEPPTLGSGGPKKRCGNLVLKMGIASGEEIMVFSIFL